MPVIAVIGASNDRRKFGNKAFRAFRKQGYTVVAINLHEAVVEGQAAYQSVLDYPGPIDEATLYVQPEAAVGVIDEIARKRIPTVWLNPGADAPEVVARARELGINAIVACSLLAVGETPADW